MYLTISPIKRKTARLGLLSQTPQFAKHLVKYFIFAGHEGDKYAYGWEKELIAFNIQAYRFGSNLKFEEGK